MTPVPPYFDTLDAPVFYWAEHHATRVAIDDGACVLTFAELAAAVQRRAEALRHARAPAVVWVQESGGVAQRVVDFLGIIHSGRCAAVSDPDWPAAVKARVFAQVPQTPSDLHTST